MTILITGVSSGFGKAMAERLAAEGHRVYGTVRRETAPIEGVTYLYADSQDEDAIAEAAGTVLEKEKAVDVLICNAGAGIGGPLEFCGIEDIEKLMDVNFMGMARWVHYILPSMRMNGHGKIICMSSIGGVLGLPFQGAYSASKFAVEGYCEALGLELRGSGVSVTLIEPGDFSTGFTAARKNVASAEAAEAYPSYRKALEGIEHDETSGLRPEYLAGKISAIIRKKTPARRYVIASPLQKLSVFAKRVLPAPLFGKILSLYYGV